MLYHATVYAMICDIPYMRTWHDVMLWYSHYILYDISCYSICHALCNVMFTSDDSFFPGLASGSGPPWTISWGGCFDTGHESIYICRDICIFIYPSLSSTQVYVHYLWHSALQALSPCREWNACAATVERQIHTFSKKRWVKRCFCDLEFIQSRFGIYFFLCTIVV